MKKILELVTGIERWTEDDQDAFIETGEVPYDSNFIFIARKKTIEELKQLLLELNK